MILKQIMRGQKTVSSQRCVSTLGIPTLQQILAVSMTMLHFIQLRGPQQVACIMAERGLLGFGSLFPDIHGVL